MNRFNGKFPLNLNTKKLITPKKNISSSDLI